MIAGENSYAIYIYGKGGHGKAIAWVIDLLNKETGLKRDYCFIDDSSSSLSLLALRERIVQDKESLIVISSIVHKEEMINKCLKSGLMNYCDGVRYFGNKVKCVL